MSSVVRGYSQVLTRKFVVTPAEWGAYFYTDADVDTWYEANSSNIRKIGNTYLIDGTAPGTTVVDVLTGNNGATEIDPDNPRISDRKTLTDVGKEIVIGTSQEPRLLVLRKVIAYVKSSQAPGSTNSNDVGYVVTENNTKDFGDNTGRFTVRVARV
jgi:hypothetical protein